MVLGYNSVTYPDHSTNQPTRLICPQLGWRRLVLPINSPGGSEAQEPLQVGNLHIAQHQLGQSLAN